MTLRERWESKIDKGSDHWIWTGAFYGSGYGTMRNENMVQEGAHRISFRLHKGPIHKGLHILHVRECGIKACVHPDHLYAGTRSQNIQDAIAVGVMNPPAGERSGRRVLSAAQVIEIRRDSRPQKEVAAEYGISRGTVYYIKSGRTWASVAVGGV